MTAFLTRLQALVLQSARAADLPLLRPSPAAMRVEDLAAKAALAAKPILIRGAAGTGKALVARRIHALSDRKSAPFLHVNLAREIDPSGALFGPIGACVQSGDGVLVLNALERLTIADQSRLMGWLDTAPACQIIAACTADIADFVRSRAFPGDLWSRLDAFEIPIPPLSDRPDDTVWLLHQLFNVLNPRRPVPLRGISALAEDAVRGHDWPGNGRELRSRVVQALGTATGDWLFPADLFPERQAGRDMLSLAETRDAAERLQIVAALERTGGQVAEAAK